MAPRTISLYFTPCSLLILLLFPLLIGLLILLLIGLFFAKHPAKGGQSKAKIKPLT